MEHIQGTNTIVFCTVIDDNSALKLTKMLLQLENDLLSDKKILKRKFKKFMNYEDDKKSEYIIKEPKLNWEIEPIVLKIKTKGGSITSAFSIIDTINNMIVPVHTICTGMVASAGTLISLAGKKRMMTKNAYMLIHELRSSSWGKYSELQDNHTNSTLMMNHIKKYYTENTNIPEDQLEDILRKDLYWSSDKCLETGLVDEII
jgi:ATP-dependent Clp endopeptidase proteolytic subunit ClpP